MLEDPLLSTGLAYGLYGVDCGVLEAAADGVLEGPAVRGRAMPALAVHRHDRAHVGGVVAGDALHGVLRSAPGRHALPHALHSLQRMEDSL